MANAVYLAYAEETAVAVDKLKNYNMVALPEGGTSNGFRNGKGRG
jgi:hypothetical protein